jgi:cytidine deaminase
VVETEAGHEQVCAAARAALRHAYAPYSGVRVGAAVLGQEVYTGVNVENASYGASLCAERSALAAAVTAGDAAITAIAIAIESDDLQDIEPLPCGICRQWIAELAPDAKILLCGNDGTTERLVLNDLLPRPFGIPGKPMR